MAKNVKTGVMASVSDLERVLDTSIVKLGKALEIQGLKFFPNGIALISIKAKVGGIEVELAVAGPDAGSSVADSGAATSGPPAPTPRPSVR